MSDLQVIRETLMKAARRQRWARALRGMWIGLLGGSCLSLALVLAYVFLPLSVMLLPVAASAPLAGMLGGLLAGAWRTSSLVETARWVDQHTNLKERLSTALEMASGPGDDSWKTLVLSDAANHAQEVDAKKLVTFSLPRASRWALLVLAIVAGLGFVPEYRSKAYLQKQADQENIKDAGRRLTELTRRNLEKRTPAMEPTQKSMDAVNELGDKLTKASLTRSEALKDLANVAEKLKEQLEDLSQDPSLKRLQDAARSSGGSQTQPGAQKQMENLQQKLGNNSPTPDKLEDLKRKLEKIQSVAKAMANDPSAATDTERQKASESLSELSRQAQTMGLQLPELDAALEALAANQTDLFLKEMEAALVDLDKLHEMSKALQQLQESGQQLGKDLAEQLQRGQAEAAATTLRKMSQQLQAGNLSKEELERLLEEVRKALPSAANYGEVAKHLKNGATCMGSGDRAGASSSLGEAAKELEKLMEQLADAEMLMAELAALQQASMCIGTGQGWAACKRPAVGPGGRPEAGVGTWADEGTEWDGSMTDHWDNSGLIRPDMAPRGLTERAQNDPGDALKPTRVKGQFSPGGEMPSISLKGVSIKGQSSVDYQAAATAAQAEAESALTQQKVPKMYQGTVRDYFDEMRK
jgi:hypothetical protein